MTTTSVEVCRRSLTLCADFPLRLECGRELGPIEVAFETYGEHQVDAHGDNTVLVCHALTGDAHAAGADAQTGALGWWDGLIGAGKAIDTDRWHVVCANFLGGCSGTTGPMSIDSSTGEPWRLSFPQVTVGDMVEVQALLLRAIGVERVHAVIGGSVGGMQALEWAARFPDRVGSVAAIATTPRLSPQAIAFNAVGRNAILRDPGFAGGAYEEAPERTGHGSLTGPRDGLATARMLAHITYLSEEAMVRKFGRALRDADEYRYAFGSEFSVETYLEHQGARFVERFDANCYLYLTKAMDYFDLGADRGGSAEALRAGPAVTLVSFTSDWLFPTEQSRRLAFNLLGDREAPGCAHAEIVSDRGHDAFLLEDEALGRVLRGVLEPMAAPGSSADRTDATAIESLLSRGERVLDVGCGDGSFVKRLNASGIPAAGIERDGELVARAIAQGAPVVQADAASELHRLTSGSFDVVVLSRTLETLERPAELLGELLRVVGGGRVIVSFANAANWRAQLGRLATGRSPGALGEARSISIADLWAFCAQAGVLIDQIDAIDAHGRRVRTLAGRRARDVVAVLRASG